MLTSHRQSGGEQVALYLAREDRMIGRAVCVVGLCGTEIGSWMKCSIFVLDIQNGRRMLSIPDRDRKSQVIFLECNISGGTFVTMAMLFAVRSGYKTALMTGRHV